MQRWQKERKHYKQVCAKVVRSWAGEFGSIPSCTDDDSADISWNAIFPDWFPQDERNKLLQENEKELEPLLWLHPSRWNDDNALEFAQELNRQCAKNIADIHDIDLWAFEIPERSDWNEAISEFNLYLEYAYADTKKVST